MTAKKCTKTHDARANLLFFSCQSKPISFAVLAVAVVVAFERTVPKRPPPRPIALPILTGRLRKVQLFYSFLQLPFFFSLSFVIGCNGTAPQILNSTFVKAILSPGFVANNYGNMQHCQWLIWAPLGYRIHVQFTAFRLQDCQNCSCDNVIIYDGGYLQEPRLGQYCGYDLPPPISSSGNQVLVTFQSDGFYSDGRFRLEYSSKSTGKHLQLSA